MKKFLLLTAIFWLCGSSFAQNPHSCAVDSLLMSYPDYKTKTNAFAAELSEFRSRTPLYHQFLPNGIQPLGITAGCEDAAYITPVVIHVDTSGGIVNVSDTQVHQQLVILNNAFAPHGIRFVLAKKKPKNEKEEKKLAFKKTSVTFGLQNRNKRKDILRN